MSECKHYLNTLIFLFAQRVAGLSVEQRWASTLGNRTNVRHRSNIRAPPTPPPPRCMYTKCGNLCGQRGRKWFIASWGLRMSHICPCTPCPSPQWYRSKVESRHFAHHCCWGMIFACRHSLPAAPAAALAAPQLPSVSVAGATVAAALVIPGRPPPVWGGVLVMATISKGKRMKASIMGFSSISKRSEHVR
jgi:hypothetical protein